MWKLVSYYFAKQIIGVEYKEKSSDNSKCVNKDVDFLMGRL